MSCNKVSYSDKRAVQTMMNQVMKRRRRRPKHLRAYYCNDCHAWHLTKQENEF